MYVDPWLPRAAALRPARVAVAEPGRALTYAQLLARARALAGGLRPGQVVALALPAGVDFALALHACLLAGAVAMPVDPRVAERERAPLLARAGAVLDADALAAAGDGDEALAPPAPVAAPAADAPAPGAPAGVPAADAPALLVHTSGTTGAPRPVTLSLANIQANALGSAVALGLDPDERWLCPLPLAHVGGLMVLLRSAIYATTAVLAPPPFDPGRVAAADVTLMSLVPTQLQRLLAAGAAPPPRLRAVLLGGAPAARALLARAAAAGWPVSPTYGLTEACSQVTVAAPGDLDTAGRPLPGTRVTIAPDGEIVVAGPTVAGGGPLHTGDIGRLYDGALVVTGRKADTIVSGGENVAPQEVEAVLLEHAAVADAGVAGRADPHWGEAVCAWVVPAPGAAVDAEALRAHCAERLARFKVPKRIALVDALPRTASGKLRRRDLPAG